MGLGYGQAGALREVLRSGEWNERKLAVCDLGSQRVFPKEVNRILNTTLSGTDVPAGQIYSALGFQSYTSIDLDGADGAKRFDLNKSLEITYGFSEQFDLVCNFGTAEHIFDQAVFFSNVHQLTKTGGLMLHSLPSRGWVNHGFYRYDSVMTQDLAEANGYETVYINRAHRYRPRFLNRWAAREPKLVHVLASALSLFGLTRKNTSIIVVFKKNSDSAFVQPIQGMYSYLRDAFSEAADPNTFNEL